MQWTTQCTLIYRRSSTHSLEPVSVQCDDDKSEIIWSKKEISCSKVNISWTRRTQPFTNHTHNKLSQVSHSPASSSNVICVSTSTRSSLVSLVCLALCLLGGDTLKILMFILRLSSSSSPSCWVWEETGWRRDDPSSILVSWRISAFCWNNFFSSSCSSLSFSSRRWEK